MSEVKDLRMNINNYCMNKTNIDGLQSMQLLIEFSDVETLGEFWNKRQLLGIHWRLYYNSAPGAGLILPDGRRIDLLPENIYLIAPYPQISSYCSGNPEHLFIHFILPGCHSSKKEPILTIPVDDSAMRLISELKKQLKQRPQDPMSQLYATALTSLTLTRLPQDTFCQSEIDGRINQACDAMRENPGHDWSNSGLARRFGFATNAFTRRFREVMGVPPYRYLSTLRYAQAARLLESSNLSIEDICERIGIKDRFHFSREFKRFHERSPSLYRKVRTAMNKSVCDNNETEQMTGSSF